MSQRQFNTSVKEIEKIVSDIYEQGVTLGEAEKLAGKFLHYQIQISDFLKESDLDARMRKTGVKAIKAAVYLNACKGHEKKPTEAQLAATVDSDSIVSSEQEGLDRAEVARDEIERIYNICREAHIYLRGISKGRFDG